MTDLAAPRIRLGIVLSQRWLLTTLPTWIAQQAGDIVVTRAVQKWQHLGDLTSFDVALVDADDREGLSAVAKTRRLAEDGVAPVLLSAGVHKGAIRRSLNSGALGYLLMSDPTELVVDAVRRADSGVQTLSPTFRDTHHTLMREHPHLAAQEERVLALYGSGLSVKGVADELELSPDTIVYYVKTIRKKYQEAGFDAGTKPALYGLARSAGLVE